MPLLDTTVSLIFGFRRRIGRIGLLITGQQGLSRRTRRDENRIPKRRARAPQRTRLQEQGRRVADMRDDVRPGAVVGGTKKMVGGIVEEEHGARDASAQHEEMRQYRTLGTYDFPPFPTEDIPGLGRLVGSAATGAQLSHRADCDGREPAAKERTHVQWGMPEMTRFVPAVDG